MPESAVPYVPATGRITLALAKIRQAATPDRFTHDFLSTTFAMKGGSARPVIPFLKRIGFLATDGSPTELYRKFRNEKESGAAAAAALRHGYAALYEVNENAHKLNDTDLRGLIVQVTGWQTDSSTAKAAVGSFKILRDLANFAPDDPTDVQDDEPTDEDVEQDSDAGKVLPSGLSLGYTINVHLPATSDIAVFNAIFKSLRDNLL